MFKWMFNSTIFFVLSFLILINVSYSKGNTDDWPVLKGPYLGQKPPGLTPELFAPGIISTKIKRELNSVFSPKGDEFYFAIYTPKPKDKCIIWCSKQINGMWTKPEVANFSGKTIDVDMALSMDGNKLYFCSLRPMEQGAKPVAKHAIWFCNRLKKSGWSEPIKLGTLINTSESETYPCLTQKGRMFFASTRKGGRGGKDIYYSQQIKGKFLKPVNIGDAVNTQYGEGDTFVAPDESFLIVSSSGRPDSLGGSDLYISFKKPDGTWTVVKNMGKTVNTKDYEYSPMASPDGKYLFFSRFSEAGSDIFWVDSKVIDKFRPKKF
jgi:hypothetical protein